MTAHITCAERTVYTCVGRATVLRRIVRNYRLHIAWGTALLTGLYAKPNGIESTLAEKASMRLDHFLKPDVCMIDAVTKLRLCVPCTYGAIKGYIRTPN